MKRTSFFTRREMIRGMAAMPLLGTMLRTSRAAAAGQSLPRFCALFFGNGVHPSWVPSGTGTTFTLSPALAPLEEIRSKVIIVKNLNLYLDKSQGHYVVTRGLLSGWKIDGGRPSMDQVLADRFAAGPDRPPVHSLQLGMNVFNVVWNYSNATPSVALPPETNPLKAYQRLVARFVPSGGSSPQEAARLKALLLEGKSVLDGVRGEISSLSGRVSAPDREQLDAYLASLRSIEDGLSVGPPSGNCQSAPTAPAGGVPSYVNRGSVGDEHSRLLRQHLDVVAFALACGLTRVATVMMSDYSLHYSLNFLGQNHESHNISHYISLAGGGGLSTAKRIELITQTTQYFMSQTAYLVKKLDALPDAAGGTVLDNSVVLTATHNGDSNAHSGGNTPFILAGQAGGRLRPGRVVDGGGRQHNDLLVSVAQAVGVTDMQKFGDPAFNRGPLPGLT